MRDDSARWDPPGPLSFASDALTLREVSLPRQVTISGIGVLDRFADTLIGWPDIAASETYALSLRRDRVLYVGEPGLSSGYDPESGLGVTDMADGYRVLDLSGPGALEALRRGAELSLDRPSRSVLRRVFGLDLLLYRVGDGQSFRLHVERAFAQALAAHLRH